MANSAPDDGDVRTESVGEGEDRHPEQKWNYQYKAKLVRREKYTDLEPLIAEIEALKKGVTAAVFASRGYSVDQPLAIAPQDLPNTFTDIAANHSIQAYFSINVFTITASASAGGSISPSGTINVNDTGGFAITGTVDRAAVLNNVLNW